MCEDFQFSQGQFTLDTMAFIKGTQSSENGVKHALGMYQMNHTKYIYTHTHTAEDIHT